MSTHFKIGFDKEMNNCPCCSNLLLQHIRKSETYWFCRTCWQEMPVFTQNLFCSLPETVLSKTPVKIKQQTRASTSIYLRERHSINRLIKVQNLSALCANVNINEYNDCQKTNIKSFPMCNISSIGVGRKYEI